MNATRLLLKIAQGTLGELRNLYLVFHVQYFPKEHVH